MRRRMAERLRCGKGTKILVSNIPGWLLQWKGRGIAVPWSTCPFSNQGVVGACDELCLQMPTQISWWVGRGEKKGICAPSSLLDLRDQGSQPSTFPQKRRQEKKSNAVRESLQGEHKESKMFCIF